MCGVALHVRGAAWSLPAAHGRAVDPHTHVRQWARQMDDVRSAVSRLFLHGRSSTAPQAQSLRPIDLTGVLRHHAMRVVSTGTGVAVQIFTEYAACALRPTVARRGGWGGGEGGAGAQRRRDAGSVFCAERPIWGWRWGDDGSFPVSGTLFDLLGRSGGLRLSVVRDWTDHLLRAMGRLHQRLVAVQSRVLLAAHMFQKGTMRLTGVRTAGTGDARAAGARRRVQRNDRVHQ